MTIDFVLTVVARDKPGLVGLLADVVAEHGGNWIDSAMARLGGEFAGIVRVSVPDESATALEVALALLAERNIAVVVHRGKPAVELAGRRVRIEVTGQDRTGIVREVAGALAAQGVSVEELRTRVFAGSMSGESLFSALADVIVPADVSLEAVRHALETIAHDIMVDIELSEVDDTA